MFCLCLSDTLLSTDPAFHRHLVLRTPTDEAPLNWTSDDSETENLISAAENLISIQSQANIRPCFAVPTSEEQVLGYSAAATEEFEADRNAGNESPIPLSMEDLVVQNIDGRPVLQLSPECLQSLQNSPHLRAIRQRSEPTLSAAGSGDASRLEHQASAPGNLEEVAMSGDLDQGPVSVLSVCDPVLPKIDGIQVLKLSTEHLQSLQNAPRQHAVGQRSETTLSATSSGDKNSLERQRNVEEASISSNQDWKLVSVNPNAPAISAVPLPTANLHRQSPIGSASNIPSPRPSQGGVTAVSSTATSSRFQLEPSVPPASWNTVSHQGARPKDVPIVVNPVMGRIPTFVEEETLSEDEEDDKACKYLFSFS